MEQLLDRLEEARAVLIAGPTASGKSALAIEFAEQAVRSGRRAVIINADSMQVYDALRILTARPTPEEEARLSHRLYGHVAAETRYSAGAWLRDLSPVLAEAESSAALAIIVGGTGLYFSALTKGMPAVPAIPAEVRRRWSERLAGDGATGLFEELRKRDPSAAATIRATDPQRIVRALEVIDATGRSLQEWQDIASSAPLLDRQSAVQIVLEPDRGLLYRRLEARFDRMIESGALDEVGRLLDRQVAPDLPVMKAIGVKLLAGYLRGQLPLEAAVAGSKQETRRFAKRQMTWFRNQMPDWERLAV